MKQRLTYLYIFIFHLHFSINTYANQVSVDYSYDQIGRLVNSSYSSGQQISYQYDAVGNLTRVIHNGSSAPQEPDPSPVPGINLTFAGSGTASIMDGSLPQIGSALDLLITAERGFRPSRQVGGDCPQGQWLSSQHYRTGELTGSCAISFNFAAVQKSRLPVWLPAVIEQD